jgi:hypothetical protein
LSHTKALDVAAWFKLAPASFPLFFHVQFVTLPCPVLRCAHGHRELQCNGASPSHSAASSTRPSSHRRSSPPSSSPRMASLHSCQWGHRYGGRTILVCMAVYALGDHGPCAGDAWVGVWGDFCAGGGAVVGGSVVGDGAAGEDERVVVDTRYDHVSSSLAVTLSDRLEVLSLQGIGQEAMYHVHRHGLRPPCRVWPRVATGWGNSGSVMVKKADRFKLLRSVGSSEIMGMDIWVRTGGRCHNIPSYPFLDLHTEAPDQYIVRTYLQFLWLPVMRSSTVSRQWHSSSSAFVVPMFITTAPCILPPCAPRAPPAHAPFVRRQVRHRAPVGLSYDSRVGEVEESMMWLDRTTGERRKCVHKLINFVGILQRLNMRLQSADTDPASLSRSANHPTTSNDLQCDDSTNQRSPQA